MDFISAGLVGVPFPFDQVNVSLGGAVKRLMAAHRLKLSAPESVCQHCSSAAGWSFLAASAGRFSLLRSQIRAVVSALAEARSLLSGEKATALKGAVWALKAASSVSELKSQTWMP